MTWLAVASVGIPVLCGMSALLAWWARDRRSPPAVDRHPSAGSPLRRVLLFSAGAKSEMLRRAPTEDGIYLGVGSMVIGTSMVAASSMFIALTVAYEQYDVSWWAIAGIALLYGSIIYTIDKLLVSVQMNPIRFLVARGLPTEPALAKTTAGTLLAPSSLQPLEYCCR